MNDAKVQEIQNELMKNIDKETKIEEDIVNAVEVIASSLISMKKCTAEIDNRQFVFAYSVFLKPIKIIENKKQKIVNKNHVVIMATDILKYKMFAGEYSPFISSVEYDDKYDLKTNIKTALEGLIRHITGNFKPEMLEE